jgi:hypothetical protein
VTVALAGDKLVPSWRTVMTARPHLAVSMPLLLVALLLAPARPASAFEPVAIVSPRDASPLESLAAREIRRYLYLRTDRLLPIESAMGKGPVIVVGRADRPAVRALVDEGLGRRLDALLPQERLLVTVRGAAGTALVVTGGDEVGVLYAAYRLAECLGVRFFLHGDVLPDGRHPPNLPDLDEHGRPLFAVRGIQPFHDFPEGPDWWGRDDWKAVLGQLPKLGMNFVGLHTYPEGRPNAEPTVWIGPPEDIGDGVEVEAAYPSSWFTTLRGNWGYAAKPTGDYTLGADQFFHLGTYGSDVTTGLDPPWNAPDERLLFARAADVLRDAFSFARSLGVKTCVGTETPLVVPEAVRVRLEEEGLDAADPKTVERLYEGTFRRAAQAYPLDYFWFWTPEGWTWEGVSDEEVRRTVEDLRLARSAWERVQPPFVLATSGWVLGPVQDRTLFDRELPKDMPLSCINRTVGMSSIERGFSEIEDRPTWAIPWLEDDPALTIPQLWVGRMRRDAADALRYDADGLIGIHWRTREVGPNVLALARAGWDQSSFADAVQKTEGPVGGHAVSSPSAPIEGVKDPTVYRTQRCGLTGYRLQVPDGRYAVTLRFAELRAWPPRRAWDVRVEDRAVLTDHDFAEDPGLHRSRDVVAREVEVEDGWLDVDLVDRADIPCLAALEVVGAGVSRRINVGGPAYGDFEADLEGASFAPTLDLYRDWADASFGPAAADDVADLFARLDSRLPRPATWVEGPGGLVSDERPWTVAREDYAFVDDLAALRPLAKGAGSLERFDFWLESFRYMRAMGELGCLLGRLQPALAEMREASPDEKSAKAEVALEVLREMVPVIERVHRHLYATVSTRGSMGTVANWQQHVLPRVFQQPAREIAHALGRPLPHDVRLGRTYEGPERLIVPTARTLLEPGEPLRLEAIVLGTSPPLGVRLHWRPLGTGEYRSESLRHVARGVWELSLPSPGEDFEYYVEAEMPFDRLRVPAPGPALPRTVVLGP